jgi:cell division protein FtsB
MNYLDITLMVLGLLVAFLFWWNVQLHGTVVALQRQISSLTVAVFGADWEKKAQKIIDEEKADDTN